MSQDEIVNCIPLAARSTRKRIVAVVMWVKWVFFPSFAPSCYVKRAARALAGVSCSTDG
jgi:hypothetical protein